jgi:DNA-binding GntR family transcriptional regulator
MSDSLPVPLPEVHAMSEHRKFVLVADELHDQITDGTLKPGYPMPTIGELHEKSCHSRHTIGRALQILEARGLVERVKGKGYFVAD